MRVAAALACAAGLVIAVPVQAQRMETDLSGTGWNLWLDKKAEWKNDTLYLPPVDLKSLPANLPTGGWQALSAASGKAVSVPGTVEEYLWDEIGGDYQGVSWWWRDLTLPAAAAGKRLILQFESVRLRAEVFLNGELVGYDVVGNTPFDVDITGKGKIGATNRLAVRITDPSGNFDWYDPDAHSWGNYRIPASHGFGGITGPVKMLIVDPMHVADIFVKNKPAITDIDVNVTVANATASTVNGNVQILIKEAAGKGRVVHTETIKDLIFQAGETVVARPLSVPNAKVWSLEHPNLYVCEAHVACPGTESLREVWYPNAKPGEADRGYFFIKEGQFDDAMSVRFGFRWFGVDGIGKDAMFRLNGKRVVLRSAISWGFWPTSGIYPTDELARRQVEVAKSLGQNMVNFHRCIGPPLCLDKADEMGLFYYEEPGGYASHGGNDFTFAWAREKLLRMVKRDRNHPSLIIYSMINEEGAPPAEHNKKDMADAHQLDPSRVILYTSAWARQGDDPIKLHMRPYDSTQYIAGWYDEHHALGPGVYLSGFYQNPTNYYLYTQNKSEIVFWGEEGAISSPPRLEKINAFLEKTGRNGWDGAAYRKWYEAYVKYLDSKHLRKYFPTVDDLTRSMGNIPYYYQGRIIENIRAGNVTDAYVANGWEAELLENHSGIVDCWRNPKGDASILARYNRPLYVAVKVRNKVVQVPETVVTDFYIVNEANLKGSYRLRAWLAGPGGRKLWSQEWPVTISGGDVYGELLVEGAKAEVPKRPGRYVIEARLVGSDGKIEADGRDEVFAVDWKSSKLTQKGAVIEPGSTFRDFLGKQKGLSIPIYSEQLGKLDYVLIGDSDPERRVVIPTECLFTPDGSPGLAAEYFTGRDLKTSTAKRTDPVIDFDWSSRPPSVPADDFSVRWTGKVKPTETGDYAFHTITDDGVRLWLDGKLVIDNWTDHGSTLDSTRRIRLEAGKTYDIKLEFYQAGGGAETRLLWTLPSMTAAGDAVALSILGRVKNDGTTALFVDGTERWAKYLSNLGILSYSGTMIVGDVWVGGNLFVRKHPLFKDLPTNQGMNWEYQDLVSYGARRYGLMLEGEEAIVGTVNANEPRVGTAVAVINYGKGKIVLSTLDIARFLNTASGGGQVVGKLLCNYLEYAGAGGR